MLAVVGTAGSALLLLLYRLSLTRQQLPPPRADLVVAWGAFAEEHGFELTESLGTGVLTGTWRDRVTRLTWSPSTSTVTVSSGLATRLSRSERELSPARLQTATGRVSLLEDTLLLTSQTFVIDPEPLLEVTVDLAGQLDELAEAPWRALEELGLRRVANRRVAGTLHGAEVTVQLEEPPGGPQVQLGARLDVPHSFVVEALAEGPAGLPLSDPILAGTVAVRGEPGPELLARLSDDAVRPLLLDLVHGRGARLARSSVTLTLPGLPDEHLVHNLEDLARLGAALADP